MEKINEQIDKDMKHFLAIKSASSFDNSNSELDDICMTERVKFIINKLLEYKFNIEKDVFFNKNRNRKYINLYYFKDNGFNDTICLLAHHDINNTNSMNANDNSASVINLINLIINYDLNINKNILIAFTDAEEIVDIKNNGSYRLGDRINKGDFKNVKLTINLELTAYGRNIWYDEDTILTPMLNDLKALKTRIPFNDSVSLRANGINSVCLGTVNNKDIIDIKDSGFCYTWSLCHKIADSKYCSNDMKILIDIIYSMIKKL